MPNVPQERRQGARLNVARPVKVQCPNTGKYFSGRTGNISRCGVLLRMDGPGLWSVGQRVRVGVAWTEQTALLAAAAMSDGTVVRLSAMDQPHQMAVEFNAVQQLAATA